jgi:hypothetical protein
MSSTRTHNCPLTRACTNPPLPPPHTHSLTVRDIWNGLTPLARNEVRAKFQNVHAIALFAPSMNGVHSCRRPVATPSALIAHKRGARASTLHIFSTRTARL